MPLAPSLDWASLGEETVEVLRDYLRVDTTNPLGNETTGARFLADILGRGGIQNQLIESAPGRGNLIARLAGDGTERPILLHHHIDVVYADRRYWSVDPFGGVIQNGFLYGRGALDMKSVGILQVMVGLALRRASVRLKRDLVIRATADEEAGSRYAVTLLRGSEKRNVIPPEALACIDCRLLAGDDPDEILAWVRGVVADQQVTVEAIRSAKVPNLSPPDTPLYKALTQAIQRREPLAVVMPHVLAAFTDNWVFRRHGVHAYGFTPFVVEETELSRVHGNDERISLENVRAGVRTYTELLLDFAAA